MAKIYVEVAEEFKQDFKVACLKQGLTQRSVITYLIDRWLKVKGKK